MDYEQTFESLNLEDKVENLKMRMRSFKDRNRYLYPEKEIPKQEVKKETGNSFYSNMRPKQKYERWK